MIRSRPDALVFDLDGTLWDAARASTVGWNRALEEMGSDLRVDVEGIRSVSGTPFRQCVETLLPNLAPPSEELLHLLDTGERSGIESVGGTLYPGVAEGLARLAESYPLFVVSNCPDWYLAAFLRISGLAEWLIAWDCHGASGVSKSEMLRALAEKHGLRDAVYVGDTRGDQEAAGSAGMGFVFVSYGFGEVVEPAQTFADFTGLVRHFVDLAG